ncbi:hypothetical protein [Oscillatoria sp. FACHB-1406]|uniref:hypothetical protein n=1 Tax=Oscillatoria sp. FACHB-1406 TaxID=2692846 RepID=UPI0016881CE9|nr:hypothetical protein [Oscillatoria sp. FACHB-1406]MBD2577477.1 hypothetical protein [Oscillatoria sp. FACHB-1406]
MGNHHSRASFQGVRLTGSLIGRQVSVTGWFRRGSTPWIDVDTVRVNDKIVVRSGYPVWAAGLAIVAALRAAWLIWNA